MWKIKRIRILEIYKNHSTWKSIAWWSQEFPFSNCRYLTEASLNLSVCRHLFIISERVFRVFFFSCAFFKMASFSVRHKSHLRVPHRYGNDLVSIDHDTRGVRPSSFSFHTYFDRLDSLRLYDFSKLHLWFLYLSFQGGSVAPVYNFSKFASPALTVAL